MRAFLLATTALLAAAGAPALAVAAPQPTPAQAVAAIADAPPPIPLAQLDDTVTPRAYRLDLTIDPAQPRFSGHVEIDAMVNRPGRFIYLHGRDLTMAGASVTIAGVRHTGIWQQVDDSGVARLTFATPLPAGPATFAFDYDAAFQNGPSGLFHVQVGDQWYGWSQFESIDARAAFPGFDQPGFKQPFAVTLRTPPGLTAVSNAPEAGVTRENGMDVHRFAASAPLPTYLVAMMVGPFASVTGTIPATPERTTPLPLRILSPRPNADRLTFALDNTKPIIALLEAYFGERFPFPKLDQITSPIMAGAMENAGADLYMDSMIALDAHAPIAAQRYFGMVVGHELSHQWFGDMVTPRWWDDIWLNESFANWMGFRIGQAWRPDLNIAGGALAEGFAAMDTDALAAGRPIHQTDLTNAQIDAAFDRITYGKGGQVVAMIAAYMGDAAFQRGVRRYMAAHRFGNATSTDFFAALAQEAGSPDILASLKSFVDEQGVPLLTFTPAGAGQYGVALGRYRYAGDPAQTPARWLVPMCVRDSIGQTGEARHCQMVGPQGATVPVTADAPFMPNAGGTGYYRFSLPPADWDRLIAASATLPAGEAQALADSLKGDFLAGRATATQLTELARVMSANADSYAFEASTSGLALLAQQDLLDSRAMRAWRRFTGRLLRPMLEAYGADLRAGAYAADSPERAQRRVHLIQQMAVVAQDRTLSRQLNNAAQRWLDGDAGALDPSWYGLALGTWLNWAPNRRGGSMAAARFLLDRALASQDPLFRPAALRAVAGTGRTDVAGWVLDGTPDPRLRASERLQMIATVAGTGGTRDMGYDWVRGHLPQLLAGGGRHLLCRAPAPGHRRLLLGGQGRRHRRRFRPGAERAHRRAGTGPGDRTHAPLWPVP